MWWPAIGGLAVGIGGLFEPRVLGVGYDTIHLLLIGKLVGAALIGLFVAKTLVWSIALGSGTSGGVLAPLLILGGALGAVLGAFIPGGDSGLWAAVGMAAMMAGTMRAPFTATIFLLELTHDLAPLPCIFVASIAATAVTVLLMKRSILTEKLARRGHHIAREYSVDPLNGVRVGEVMDSQIQTIPDHLPLRALSDMIARRDPSVVRHHALAVVDADQRIVGVITRGDIVRCFSEDADASITTCREGGTEPAITVYPDETVEAAVRRMLENHIGRLPVVSRGNPAEVIGYLGRQGVLDVQRRRFQEEYETEPGWLSRR